MPGAVSEQLDGCDGAQRGCEGAAQGTSTPANNRLKVLKDAARELPMQGAYLPQLLMRCLCKALGNLQLP